MSNTRQGERLIQPLLEGLEGAEREEAYQALLACNFVSESDDFLRFLCAFKILARTSANPPELRSLVEELRQAAPQTTQAVREVSRTLATLVERASAQVDRGEDERSQAIQAAKRQLDSTANFLQSLHETVAQRIERISFFNKAMIFALGGMSGVLLTALVSCHH